jgi:hypothetical protein
MKFDRMLEECKNVRRDQRWCGVRAGYAGV